MAWLNKTKLTGTWNPKVKIPTEFERGHILTHDGNQVLVGASEDEVLIYQEERTTWNFKLKISA